MLCFSYDAAIHSLLFISLQRCFGLDIKGRVAGRLQCAVLIMPLSDIDQLRWTDIVHIIEYIEHHGLLKIRSANRISYTAHTDAAAVGQHINIEVRPYDRDDIRDDASERSEIYL